MGELADRLHAGGRGTPMGFNPLGTLFRPKRPSERFSFAKRLLAKWESGGEGRIQCLSVVVRGNWRAMLCEGNCLLDEEIDADPLSAVEEVLCRWCVKAGVKLDGTPLKPYPEPPQPPSRSAGSAAGYTVTLCSDGRERIVIQSEAVAR